MKELRDSLWRDISCTLHYIHYIPLHNYITKLHEVQVSEGLRAGNKLTKRHVNFEKQKMKVYLATQTLSTSVADAIDACREDFELPQLRGSEGTVEFIRKADKTFDILNSTSLRPRAPLKKALCTGNIQNVRQEMAEARDCINGLQVKGPKDTVFNRLCQVFGKPGF